MMNRHMCCTKHLSVCIYAACSALNTCAVTWNKQLCAFECQSRSCCGCTLLFFLKKRPLVSEPSFKFSPLPFHFVFRCHRHRQSPPLFFFPTYMWIRVKHKSTNATFFTPARRNATEPENEERERCLQGKVT